MTRSSISNAFRPRFKNIFWTLAWLLISTWLSNEIVQLLITDIIFVGFPFPIRFGGLWTSVSFYPVSLIFDALIWYGVVSWILWRRERIHE